MPHALDTILILLPGTSPGCARSALGSCAQEHPWPHLGMLPSFPGGEALFCQLLSLWKLDGPQIAELPWTERLTVDPSLPPSHAHGVSQAFPPSTCQEGFASHSAWLSYREAEQKKPLEAKNSADLWGCCPACLCFWDLQLSPKQMEPPALEPWLLRCLPQPDRVAGRSLELVGRSLRARRS